MKLKLESSKVGIRLYTPSEVLKVIGTALLPKGTTILLVVSSVEPSLAHWKDEPGHS